MVTIGARQASSRGLAGIATGIARSVARVAEHRPALWREAIAARVAWWPSASDTPGRRRADSWRQIPLAAHVGAPSRTPPLRQRSGVGRQGPAPWPFHRAAISTRPIPPTSEGKSACAGRDRDRRRQARQAIALLRCPTGGQTATASWLRAGLSPARSGSPTEMSSAAVCQSLSAQGRERWACEHQIVTKCQLFDNRSYGSLSSGLPPWQTKTGGLHIRRLERRVQL
jgi:hypothetical protein